MAEIGAPSVERILAAASQRLESVDTEIARRQQNTALRDARDRRLDGQAEARRQDEFTDRLDVREQVSVEALEADLENLANAQEFRTQIEVARRQFVANATDIENQRQVDQRLDDELLIDDIRDDRDVEVAAFLAVERDQANQVAINDRVQDDRAVSNVPLDRAEFGADPLAVSDERRSFLQQLESRIQDAEALDQQLIRSADERRAVNEAIERAIGADVGQPTAGQPAPAGPEFNALDPDAGIGAEARLPFGERPLDPLNAQPVEGDALADVEGADPLARSDESERAREENLEASDNALRQERLDDRAFREEQFFAQQIVDNQNAQDSVERALFDPGADRGSIVTVAG